MASSNEEVPRAVDGATSNTVAAVATTAAIATATAAEQQVQHCLRVLQGKSDEHKFAGLLMVAKLNDLPLERLQQVRRQVLATVGVKFFLRLLHTRGTETNDSLSSFQTLGLNLIASFCSDAAVAESFADEQLIRFLLEQLTSSRAAHEAQDDCVAILHGLAATDKGTRLLLHTSTLAQTVKALEKRSQDALAASSTAAAAISTATNTNDDVATTDNTTHTAAVTTVAALWSLLEQLAGDVAFWHALCDADVAFVCGSLVHTPGGRVSLSVLAVLNKLMALVEHGTVAFALVEPHLAVLRAGVLQFMRAKWPHQERDACLQLVHDLMDHAGPSWLLTPELPSSESTGASASAVSGGKFLLVVLKLVSIEIKLLLDDVELALVQMEETQVEHVDDIERQEREVARALHILPICFRTVEMAIGTLVASLGDDDDDDDDASPLLLPYDVLLELKQALAQTFAVIFEFLTLASTYMQTHRFRDLQARGAASVAQLDAIVYASVRVVGAWIAEDPDACMAQLVTLAPFLVLYEPSTLTTTTTQQVVSPLSILESSVSSSDGSRRHAATAVISSGSSATNERDSDDEADSDDEVDSDGDCNGVRVSELAIVADRQAAATSVDPLHFLLPGLLQLSATPDGAAALTQDAAVLRRLLRFSCTLCSCGDRDDAPSLPTITLALGMLVNLLLEKDTSALSLDDDVTAKASTRSERVLHASEWRRALAFLLPLACASGATVVHDATLTTDDRGDDDRYVMLLHAVCVVLLIASHASTIHSRASSSSSNNSSTTSAAKLVAPFNELVAWLLRHPPSADSEAATDLFELVRILSLRARVTTELLIC